MMGWLAIAGGAVLGAWLRWGTSLWLNTLHSKVFFGTLAVNLAGGYLIGLAVAYFAAHPGLSQEWRLFAVTGFLGSLTTFSTFSAEAFLLLQRGDYLWAVLHACLHLFGAILLCVIGFATYRAFSA